MERLTLCEIPFGRLPASSQVGPRGDGTGSSGECVQGHGLAREPGGPTTQCAGCESRACQCALCEHGLLFFESTRGVSKLLLLACGAGQTAANAARNAFATGAPHVTLPD